MKKSFFLIIVSLVILISCTKKESSNSPIQNLNVENTSNLFSNLNMISKNHIDGVKKTRVRHAVILADAMGALGGLEAGAIAGPWGSLCGAITFGVFGSCTATRYNPDQDNNPEITNSRCSNFPNTNINSKVIGEIHNKILEKFNDNISTFISNTGEYNKPQLLQFCITEVSQEMNFSQSELSNIFSQNPILNTNFNNEDLLLSNLVNYPDEITSQICLDFFNNVKYMNAENAILYNNDFLNAIDITTALSEIQKMKIISFVEVATYSTIYHQVNLS